MDRLSGDFNRGYTKAIQDIIEIFNYTEDDLKHHKKPRNWKTAKELLQVILEERENIREFSPSNSRFIRFNGTLNKFEWFVNRAVEKYLKS